MPLEPLETNLFDFFSAVDIPAIDLRVEDDVLWFTSSIADPLFNGAAGARFEPRNAVRRANAVLDRLIDHGHPFLWWLTPNTRSAELEQALADRGLTAEQANTAMTLDLTASALLDEAPPPGVTLEPMTDANVDELSLTMLDGFAMPHELAEAYKGLLTARTTDRVSLHNVLARLHGEPVGAGSVVVTDNEIAGLYNIAVRDEARGRGVGRAVTIELMRIGAERGCSQSILHATPMGEPVYAKVGYRPAGEIKLYLWMPEGSTD